MSALRVAQSLLCLRSGDECAPFRAALKRARVAAISRRGASGPDDSHVVVERKEPHHAESNDYRSGSAAFAVAQLRRQQRRSWWRARRGKWFIRSRRYCHRRYCHRRCCRGRCCYGRYRRHLEGRHRCVRRRQRGLPQRPQGKGLPAARLASFRPAASLTTLARRETRVTAGPALGEKRPRAAELQVRRPAESAAWIAVACAAPTARCAASTARRTTPPATCPVFLFRLRAWASVLAPLRAYKKPVAAPPTKRVVTGSPAAPARPCRKGKSTAARCARRATST